MSVKPEGSLEKNLATPDSVQALNNIRDKASSQYQSIVPLATWDNLAQIGRYVTQYQSVMNDFIDGVNRIAYTIVSSKTYNNPLREFKMGILEAGESVEEMFVDEISPITYDMWRSQGTLHKIHRPDIPAVYHIDDIEDEFPATLPEDVIAKAFVTRNGVQDLIDRVVNELYSSDENSEFNYMKAIINSAGTRGDGFTVNIPDPVDGDSTKRALVSIREMALNLTFRSRLYNPMAVSTHLPIEDQIIFISTRLSAEVDVETLAFAFNMSKADFTMRAIPLDNFGGLEAYGVKAIITSKKWFRIWDKVFKMTTFYNPEGLYRTWFLHHWRLMSYSPFVPFVLFTTNPTSITDITLNRTQPGVNAGQLTNVDIIATITGTGLFNKNVRWELTGAVSGKARVYPLSRTDTTSTVRVVIPADEPAGSIINLKATCLGDTSKTGTSVISVNAP